jgi:hypothetical protein
VDGVGVGLVDGVGDVEGVADGDVECDGVGDGVCDVGPLLGVG